MKKSFLIILLLIPFVSFSQLPKKERKAIDNYADSTCQCLNELINTLDGKMVEYLNVFSEEGEVTAQAFLANYLENASEEDTNSLLESANLMQTESFGLKIEACDDGSNLSSKTSEEIENEKGSSYDYYLKVLSTNSNCKLTKMFIEMGNED